jgi:hypothetical protein
LAVAYFVQSHHRPAQALRLLGTLRRGSPDAVLVVGHCPAGEPLDATALDRLDALHFRHRRPGRRGTWSLFEPYLDAVELLTARDVPFDWLVYLSGQDYPVQPLALSEAYLQTTAHDGFLSWRDAWEPSPEGRRRQGRLRYGFQYYAPPALAPLLRVLRAANGIQRLWHVQLTYGPLLGVRALRTPFRDDFRAYVGSQWTTLRRACAELVLSRAREDHELRRYFERTLCPDEAFAQTVLVNDGRFRLRNDPLRFVDFAATRTGHPRTLDLADAAAITTGAFHFARKFDAHTDPAVMDWLDREVL